MAPNKYSKRLLESKSISGKWCLEWPVLPAVAATSVGVLLHKVALAGHVTGWDGPLSVLAQGGERVGLESVQQLVLSLLDIVTLASPPISIKTISIKTNNDTIVAALNELSALVWSARPKLKLRIQGFFALTRLIAFKLAVDSSSDCPPDRNIMPGTAGGTVRIRVVTV